MKSRSHGSILSLSKSWSQKSIVESTLPPHRTVAIEHADPDLDDDGMTISERLYPVKRITMITRSTQTSLVVVADVSRPQTAPPPPLSSRPDTPTIDDLTSNQGQSELTRLKRHKSLPPMPRVRPPPPPPVLG